MFYITIINKTKLINLIKIWIQFHKFFLHFSFISFLSHPFKFISLDLRGNQGF